jgi:2-polyprenyl-6-hydroxyphenyl methylase/3-demethylubiquinone-9 3-methyltransferase
VADALALPFAASSFDYVISSEVIEHTLNPALAVKEMARVLRPNGVLVLTCPNRRWQWLVTGASRLGLRPFDGIEDFPTFGQLEIFAAGAGLSLVCHRGFHPWPFQLRLLWPLSRALDRALGASAAGRWMINQAIRAVKSPA